MTIGQFRESEAFNLSFISNPITYLIFGGQGSVYVSKLEYCPAKKQVKLLTEPKEIYQGPVTVANLIIFPEDTEILIEGYPGDDTTPLQWETPDNVEYHPGGTIDFQRLLDDNQTKILDDAFNELHGIMETLKSDDVPDEYITKVFQKVIKDI